MSAISGTRRALKELVDGTIRVQIDIDPRFKAQFHEMFPNIDMPVALAPLVSDFEQKEEKSKVGPLCLLAVRWCKDEEFRTWFTNRFDFMEPVNTESEAAEALYDLIAINSRRELDSNPDAGEQFQNMIRIPYSEWLKKK